jgi:hypothetical protein
MTPPSKKLKSRKLKRCNENRHSSGFALFRRDKPTRQAAAPPKKNRNLNPRASVSSAVKKLLDELNTALAA